MMPTGPQASGERVRTKEECPLIILRMSTEKTEPVLNDKNCVSLGGWSDSGPLLPQAGGRA